MTVLKAFLCINTITAWPENKERENHTHRGLCDVTSSCRCHDAASAAHSNISFSKKLNIVSSSLKVDVLYHAAD